MGRRLEDYVTINNHELARKWKGRRVPMATLYEAYFDGDIDIPGDICEFMDARHDLVSMSLTPLHMKWLVKNFLPEALIHSQAQDTRIVREHYDRGNDFFQWFLGDTMVYTSAFFRHEGESLEEAQTNKLDLVCQKLQLKPGDRLLDIGCGWGTLVRHAAKHYGVDATGVTLSKEQTALGTQRIRDWGLEDKARILCMDYRDIPNDRFDKISSLEMVEHVGVKNLSSFYEQVFELLDDDGLFLLQWTGLRRGFKGEDLIWILFMGKYIFPGADASLCPAAMLKSMEKARFETQSIDRWQKNWVRNREQVVAAYGERWFRLWNFFLAWSSRIGMLGSAACFQVLLNKNVNEYDRARWSGTEAPMLGIRWNAPSPRKSSNEAPLHAVTDHVGAAE